IANLIQLNVRRGHSAAVYTSGLRSTSVGHQSTFFRVTHTGAPVDTWGVSICETWSKKVSIAVWLKGIFNHVFNLDLFPNRQLYTTSKQCFIFIFLDSYLCAKYTFCFILIGEKRLRQQATRDPRPRQPEWVVSPSPPEDVEEGKVEEVGDMGTPPGDVLVVEGEAAEPFSTDSAQKLIGQIMYGFFFQCSIPVL
ncbi:hypothetical protein AB205_0164060, partial [Aquarana catesbeiana]